MFVIIASKGFLQYLTDNNCPRPITRLVDEFSESLRVRSGCENSLERNHYGNVQKITTKRVIGRLKELNLLMGQYRICTRRYFLELKFSLRYKYHRLNHPKRSSSKLDSFRWLFYDYDFSSSIPDSISTVSSSDEFDNTFDSNGMPNFDTAPSFIPVQRKTPKTEQSATEVPAYVSSFKPLRRSRNWANSLPWYHASRVACWMTVI